MSDPKNFIKVACPVIDDQEAEAVKAVLFSGNLVSGKTVEAFEESFAAYVGTRHAVAVSSGTAALHIALEGMGIKEGDEVIVPPLTFFATVSAVLHTGARPVFADVDRDDLCLSPDAVERALTKRTKAILPVHLYGGAAKMDRFVDLSRRYGVCVLEDCAQAHGTEYKGTRVGGIGTAGAFSFFATKHMTTGEGGMITTNDSELANRCNVIRNHGMTDRNTHSVLGFNNRMTEIEAAIGLVQLQKLDTLNSRRIANSEYLIRHLKKLDWCRIPVPVEPVRHTYFWCPVMLGEGAGNRTIDELKAHLRRHRIEFRERYTAPLNRQKVLVDIDPAYARQSLPNAEAFAGQIIGLPNHPNLETGDLDRIIRVLEAF